MMDGRARHARFARSDLDEDAIARSLAHNRAYLRRLELEGLYKQGISGWVVDANEDVFLRNIHASRLKGRMLWCNWRVRDAAMRAIVDAFLADFAVDRARRRYFLTFCWDAGMTWERRPHVDLVALKNMINHRLRRLQLHGIGIVELDILKNLTGEPGRRILVHVHCYCWPANGTFKPRKTEETLCQRSTLSNVLKAPSVDIQPVRLFEASVAHLAGYLFDPPSRAKNHVPSRKKPGSYKMREAKLDPAAATRIIEILSHMEFRDVMFAVGGGGTALARAIRKNFAAETRRWRGPRWIAPSAQMVACRWSEIRSRNGSVRLRPCVIITRARQRHARMTG